MNIPWKGIALVLCLSTPLGWFFGEPLRKAANRFIPAGMRAASILPSTRATRPWTTVLEEQQSQWLPADSLDDFYQRYETCHSFPPPVRACLLARLAADWHAFEPADLFTFALGLKDEAFTTTILQLAYQEDPSSALAFVAANIPEESERHLALEAWLLKASEGDATRMRNLIVEHQLADSNKHPLLTFADPASAFEEALRQQAPLQEILQIWQRRDPEAASQKAQEHQISINESPLPAAQEGPGQALLALWETHKPQTRALEAPYLQWLNDDPQAARTWAVTHDEPAFLDLWRFCQSQKLTTTPGGTPRSAYELSLEIADPAMQQRAAESALIHWLRIDPKEALAVLANAPIEDATRESLTQRAQVTTDFLKLIDLATAHLERPR